MKEGRRIADFIMGGCAGFCFFIGGFLGYGIGGLMLLSHGVMVFRERMLNALNKDLEKDGVKQW